MATATEKRLFVVKITKDDFAHARAFIAAARTHKRETLEHDALVLIAIIHYARPFSGNRPGNLSEMAPPARNVGFSDAQRAALKAPAIDVFHLEGVYIHAIQASHVDGRHFRASLRVRPDRERLNAAG